MAAYVAALFGAAFPSRWRGRGTSKGALPPTLPASTCAVSEPAAKRRPEALMQRLLRDLQVEFQRREAHGGHLEAVFGTSTSRAFGAMQLTTRGAQALRSSARPSVPENAFEEPQTGGDRHHAGEAVIGAVNFTDNAERTVIGLPLQQVEGCWREARTGRHPHGAGGSMRRSWKAWTHRHRAQSAAGLLLTQAIFILGGEEATRRRANGSPRR